LGELKLYGMHASFDEVVGKGGLADSMNLSCEREPDPRRARTTGKFTQ